MFSDDNIWPLKLWLFLAALNGNYCGISSVGPISCSLTQPLSLSHFVCRLLLLTQRDLVCRTPLRVVPQPPVLYVGRMAGGHPKPWHSSEAVETFLKLSSFLTDKLFCMGMWGGVGRVRWGGGRDWSGCQGN